MEKYDENIDYSKENYQNQCCTMKIDTWAGENGLVCPQGITNVRLYDCFTIYVKANEGYHIHNVTIDENSIYDPDLQQNHLEEFCYTLRVTGSHSIKAYFQKITKDMVTITFDSNGGEEIAPITIEKGSQLSEMPKAIKKGYAFTGWFLDPALSKDFLIEEPILNDLILYASYEFINEKFLAYPSTELFLTDCPSDYTIELTSNLMLNDSNLSQYVTLKAYIGTLPLIHVIAEEGRYLLLPDGVYTPAGYYQVTLSDGVYFFNQEESIREMQFKVFKEQTAKIEYVDGIKTIEKEEVLEQGSDTVKLPLSYGEYNVGDIILFTTKDKSELQYRKVTKVLKSVDTQILWFENCEFEDVYRSIDLFQTIPIDIAGNVKTEDMERMARELEEGEGIRQIATIAAHALNQSREFQMLSIDPEGDFVPIGGYDIKHGDYHVTVTYGEGNNSNFPSTGTKWTYFKFMTNLKITLHNNIAIVMNLEILQGISSTLQGYNETHGSFPFYVLDFDYAINTYTQTNINISAIIKTVDESYSFDVSEMIKNYMNGSSKYDAKNLITDLKNLYGTDVSSITLFETTLVEIPINILYVINVTFSLDLNIKFKLAAGFAFDFKVLTAKQAGFYAYLDVKKRDLDMDLYQHELFPIRYDLSFYFEGYLRISVGLVGRVTVSIAGLSWLGSIGAAIEIGPYFELYGFYYVHLLKDSYSPYVSTDSAGGYYMELGIYIEPSIELSLFTLKAAITLFSVDIPIFNYGDKYLLLRYNEFPNFLLIRSERINFSNLGLLNCDWLDLLSLETISDTVENENMFYIRCSNNNFSYDFSKRELWLNPTYLGRAECTLYVYYTGGSIDFVNKNMVKQIKLLYVTPAISLQGEDPYTLYKIRYLYDNEVKFEYQGYVGESIQYPLLNITDKNSWGFSWNIGGEWFITKNRDITANIKYRSGVVSFVYPDCNGKLQSTRQEVQYGQLPSVPTLPECQLFKNNGWGEPIVPVNVYFKCYSLRYDIYKYNVAFYYPSVVLVEYNQLNWAPSHHISMPNTPYGTVPLPLVTVDYPGKYDFVGWDKSIEPVSKDIVYTGSFNKVTLMVTFLDEKGGIFSRSNYQYADTLRYPSTPPVKPDEGETIYVFDTWLLNGKNSNPTYVEDHYVFTPQYIAQKKRYTITLDAGEGTFLTDKTKEYLLEYGTDPNPIVESPVKSMDQRYEYQFNAWNLPIVTKNAIYTATFQPILRYYQVILDGNGGLFEQGETILIKTMTFDQMLSINSQGIVPPSKAMDNQYEYVFSEWYQNPYDPTKFKAIYTEVLRLYVLTLDTNGGKFIDQTTTFSYMPLPYGSTVTVLTDIPIRNSDHYNSYLFIGWMKSDGTIVQGGTMTEINKNTTYYAQFQSQKIIYTITISAGGGIFNDSESVKTYTGGYGESFGFDFVTNAPSKESDLTYQYTFTGWGEPVSNVIQGTHTYTAIYRQTYLEYHITFFAGDGLFTSTGTNYLSYIGHYGEILTQIEEPVKAQQGNYKYVFNGWSPSLEPVTKAMSYTATYRVKRDDTDPVGIIISKGSQSEDISVQSMPGYSYHIETYQYTCEGTQGGTCYLDFGVLEIEQSGFTLSGSGNNIQIRLTLEATSLTIRNLSIVNEEALALELFMSECNSAGTILFSGNNSFENTSVMMRFYSDVNFVGADENSVCNITVIGPMGVVSYNANLQLTNILMKFHVLMSSFSGNTDKAVAAIFAGFDSTQGKLTLENSDIELNGFASFGVGASDCVTVDSNSSITVLSGQFDQVIYNECNNG